jgi:hypothetical protein
MNAYTPKPAGLKPCAPRQSSELLKAANALGQTLVFGTEISFELHTLAKNPMHPFHASAHAESKQLFIHLQAMLVAERWLIEFLLGPPHPKRSSDICVDCFQHDWRFPAGKISDELFVRRDRINKLVMHPTWQLIDFSPRAWTLNRVETCMDALEVFANGVMASLPAVTKVLNQYIAVAKTASSHGRPDGSMWLNLAPSLPLADQPM